jgi:hypothetical protein
MATLRRGPLRLLNEPMRRKLEVATAMALEALIDAHVAQGSAFVTVLADHEPLEESLPRYLREMDLTEALATAVRTRLLALFDETPPAVPTEDETAMLRSRYVAEPDDNGDEDWSLLRRPQRVVQGVRRRQRRTEELDRIVMLALARAEENVIRTHVENAVGFVALLEEQLRLDRAVQQYVSAVGLAGGRAQTVFQRTMARLAEVHLKL